MALAGTSALFLRLQARVRNGRVLPTQPPVPRQIPAHLDLQGRRLAKGSDREGARCCSLRALGRARLDGENPRRRSRSHWSLPGTLPALYRSSLGVLAEAPHTEEGWMGGVPGAWSPRGLGGGSVAVARIGSLAGLCARRRAVYAQPSCSLRHFEEACGYPQYGGWGGGNQ